MNASSPALRRGLMLTGLAVVAVLPLVFALTGGTPSAPAARPASCEPPQETAAMAPETDPLRRSDADWRRRLTPEQHEVLRQKGTERAFTGAYWDTKTVGVYACAGCGAELFRSDAKFDSGCGWPSFFQPLDDARLVETVDESHGMRRTEVTCKRCGGHLGHVFDDGPAPTGLRFCINSASLKLEPEKPR